MEKQSVKPFLKWAGGKSKLLEKLSLFFPKKFNHYFEPFVGGGAVFFHLKPKKAYLSDQNKELINLYSQLRNESNKVIKHLKNYRRKFKQAHIEEKDSEYYYHVRNRERTQSQSKSRRAARTIFLNKTCFNGLYRINSKGKFNVPYGRTAGGKLPTIVNESELLKCSEVLQYADIKNHDYNNILKNVKKGDFVYLDPPYHAPNKASMYSKTYFDDSRQDKVALLFRKLDEIGAFVMFNNSHTLYDLKENYENINYLFENERNRIEVINTKWSIGARSEWRNEKGELLITNY